MKQASYLLLQLLLIFLSTRSLAQTDNKPNGATGPSGSVTVWSYPPPIIPANHQPPTLVNYSRIITPFLPVTDAASLTLNSNNTRVVTTYVNGFGKPLHANLKGRLGTKDVITPYDNRPSRRNFSYPAYPDTLKSKFQINPYLEQKDYYLSQHAVENTTAYSQTVSSNPSSIPTSTIYLPGAAFTGQNRGTTAKVLMNQATEDVRIITLDANEQPISNQTYPSNELMVREIIGQHNQVTKEYTNKNGQVVCKKVIANNNTLTTYYVFDDMASLRYILTPKAVSIFEASNWTVSSATLVGLCYKYSYNKYGQLIEKRGPDKTGNESFVYDRKRRPVLVQTPLLLSQNKWQFNLYDSRDRVVMTGLLDNSAYIFNGNSFTREQWQNEIDAVVSPTAGSIQYYFINGVTGAYPNSIPNCDVHSYRFFDFYIGDVLMPFQAFSNTFSGDFAVGNEYVIPIPSENTLGLLTSSKTKILDNGSGGFSNQWINSVYYYDQKGRNIQVLMQNPLNTSTGDWDISATQYDFSGNVVRSMLQHNGISNGNKSSTKVITRNIYNYEDGKLMGVEQKTDGNSWREIQTITYDDLGRVNQQMLGNVEKQSLSYNIRGQLNSINRNYVESVGSLADMTFGVKLQYDYGFNVPRYDGNFAGIIWRGAGESAPQRAYGYTYDDAGRLWRADFREFTDPTLSGTSTWNLTKNDYSAAFMNYDANGNMTGMRQRGVAITQTGTLKVNMDRLEYTYLPNSNLLDKVFDTSNADYNLYDFLNSPNNSTDYTYDANGNMTQDLNKGITAIVYNHMNLPVSVTVSGNANAGTIANSYDASGTLLQKIITKGSAVTTYRYWGPFVYKKVTPSSTFNLDYFIHPTGRARWLADSNFFKYDYFVKDHLGNVRTVVTSDVTYNEEEYFASMELASANLEGLMFTNIDEVRDTRPLGDPNDIQAANLNGNDSRRRIGTAILLRVMAGDKFRVESQSYYEQGVGTLNQHATAESMMGSLINTLTGGVNGFEGGAEGNGSDYVNSMFTEANYVEAYDAIKESMTNSADPRSYLNYIVFDDRMNIVRDQSGALQAEGNPDTWNYVGLTNDIAIQQNGYIAVYLSNEQYADVYWDNLHLYHYRGRLLDEQHYYPYGLTIRSQSNNPLPNKYLYQGKVLQDELGLELYDFHARQYDPQLGRFWGIDPADEFPSGYTGMGNNPARFMDPTGMRISGSAAFEHGNTDGSHNPPDWGEYESYLFHNQYNPTDLGDELAAVFAKDESSAAGSSSTEESKTVEAPPIAVTMDEVTISDKSSQKKNFWDNVLNVVQTGLDVVGLIPGLGEVADGINGLIYLAKGDNVNAGLSFAAMIPVAGWGATGAKLVKKGIDAIDGAKVHTVYKSVQDGVTQYVGITNKFARRAAEHLRKKNIIVEPLMEKLSRSDARAVEQTLIEIHKLRKNKGTLINEINSISPKNPEYGAALQRGYELLQTIGYQ